MVQKLPVKNPLGKSGLLVPQVIYGTSYLGNLYKALSQDKKLTLMKTWFDCTEKPVIIDTAGKYGAGLALESIGKGLDQLSIDPADIIISNKLGWYQVPLATEEPTFEPGVWVGLQNDCIQTFGYKQIKKCFAQGNELLGRGYRTEVVSVHDPDEYLFAAENEQDRMDRLQEILESYRALFDLKAQGKVKAVGIGSKDWKIIRELYHQVPFDWVMFANSFTIYNHPDELIRFMSRLHEDGVGIINSAVFHGGFLTGGSKFDYQDIDPESEKGKIILQWRAEFYATCQTYDIIPGEACVHFGLSHPAIVSIALNTSRPERMRKNAEVLNRKIPGPFWQALKEKGLIDASYPYV